jgi:hypothetical protein
MLPPIGQQMSKTNPVNLAWWRDLKTDPRFC